MMSLHYPARDSVTRQNSQAGGSQETVEWPTEETLFVILTWELGNRKYYINFSLGTIMKIVFFVSFGMVLSRFSPCSCYHLENLETEHIFIQLWKKGLIPALARAVRGWSHWNRDRRKILLALMNPRISEARHQRNIHLLTLSNFCSRFYVSLVVYTLKKHVRGRLSFSNLLNTDLLEPLKSITAHWLTLNRSFFSALGKGLFVSL